MNLKYTRINELIHYHTYTPLIAKPIEAEDHRIKHLAERYSLTIKGVLNLRVVYVHSEPEMHSSETSSLYYK